MELWIAFLSQHVVTKLHVMKKKFNVFFFQFYQQKAVHTICHDVHVCNYICMRYVNAHIHQRLNPRPDGSTPKPSPPNQFKFLLTKKKKLKFIVFGMKLFLKFKL